MDSVIDQTIGDGWAMYNGDCVEVLMAMPDAFADYALFSPPFSSLYTYSDSPRDMGNCQSDEEFFDHYGYLVERLLRVVRPGRLVSIHCMLLPTTKFRDGVIGLRDFRGDIIRAMTSNGWIHHSEVCIWKDPVTAMQRTKALGLLYKQLRKDSCMSRQGIPDYVVTFRHPEPNTAPVTKTAESFPVERWQRYASPIWTDIDQSDVLPFAGARDHRDERHVCPLQLGVIRRCIELWTNPGDTVLSPFAGVGSEGHGAITMGRRFVGVELKPSYYRQAVQNLCAASSQTTLDLVAQTGTP